MELLGSGVVDVREVVEVVIVGVYNALDAAVAAGVDLIAAGVQQSLGRLVVDAAHFHEVGDNVVYDRLDVVGVYLLCGHFGLAAHEDELFVYGLGVLVVGNVALLIHLAQHRFLALLVVFNAVEGAVVRGQVDYADD